MDTRSLILCVLSIVVHLDGLHGNQIRSLTKRNKRQCLTPFSCESTALSTQLPFIPARTNCVLPEYPNNGKWAIFDGPNKFPGDIVKAKTILHYKCDHKYKLLPEASEFSICYRFWNTSPICLKTCPSVRSTQIMHVSCELDHMETSCIDPYEGSKARITCAPSYDDPNLRKRPFINCVDGSWDAPLPECKPVLGTAKVKCRFTLVDINDESVYPAVLGEFPYMAVVGFKRESHIFFLCSGALISPSYVITTASCAIIRGAGAPEVIRVGTFNHNTNEPTAQDAKIEDIKVHPDYKPSSKYNNIALMKVSKPFILNNYVQPISIITSETTEKRGIILNFIWPHMDSYYHNVSLVRTTAATVNTEECKEFYLGRKDVLSKGIDERTQLCMTGRSLHWTTSSDGMLVTDDKQDPFKYRLIGISSLGIEDSPEIYQKLFPYLGWMNGIIG